LAKRNDGDMPPYVFAINFAFPGPPFYHLVIYYAVPDLSDIDGSKNTPFSKLAKQFFFGNSDEFRNNTFKLIPQIIEGNFLVRKAVGSTPAITGTKLTQIYIKGDRFFELIIDVGSIAVAAGVGRLCLGYVSFAAILYFHLHFPKDLNIFPLNYQAKTLKVDIAFILQGDDESTLPEQVMGCCRLKNVEFKGLRLVEGVDDFE